MTTRYEEMASKTIYGVSELRALEVAFRWLKSERADLGAVLTHKNVERLYHLGLIVPCRRGWALTERALDLFELVDEDGFVVGEPRNAPYATLRVVVNFRQSAPVNPSAQVEAA